MRSTLPAFNEIWQRQFRTDVLKQLNALQPEQNLLIGCSGGMDSMLLLHLMASLCPQKMTVVYVDHQLQTLSAAWGEFVRQQCQLLNIPCHIEKVQVGAGNLEQQARQARYLAYQKHLKPHDVLVLAHHQQDQAETALLRLLSGTGVHGLAAMQTWEPRTNYIVWRPLLEISRQQIQMWIQALGIEHIDDPTNQDTHYDRAWCRQQLWPLLEQRFPKMQQAITRASALMQDAEQILAEVLQQDVLNCINEDVLSLTQLQQCSLPRQRQLLSHWLQGESTYRPSFAMVERLQNEVILARPDAQAALYIAPYYYVRFNQNLYRLSQQQYQPSQPKPTTVALQNQQHLHLACGEFQIESAEIGLDWALLGQDLQLMPRQGGERIHLHGRVGHWPLKKAIQAAQIFPWQRNTIQILAKDDVMLGVFNPKGFWLAESAYCVQQGWLPKLILKK